MLKLFLTFQFNKLREYFVTRTAAKLITSLLFLVVLLFIGSTIYFFFISGFRFIAAETEEGVRLTLTLFIYELFLLILSGVIIFSATVSGLFNLFKGESNTWIMSTPGYKIFPKMVLYRTSVASLIPLLIMFVPAMVAFNTMYHLQYLSFLCIGISVVLFLILYNAITLLMLLFVSLCYYKLSRVFKSLRFSFGGLIGILLILIGSLITIVWNAIGTVDLVKLFRAEEITEELGLSTVGEHFRLLPSHPFAMEIISWQSGALGMAIGYFSVLLIITIVSVLAWWKFSTLFYPLWQKFQEGTSGITHGKGKITLSKTPYYFTGSSTLALFKKEMLASSRNYKGVLWFSFLSFIWLMQIATNVILGHTIQRYQPDLSQKLIMLQVIQFIIAIYFISSFTLRFVFTSLSAEKKTIWILASAPLKFTKIFFSKYFFYLSIFVTMGVLMSYINSVVLGVSLYNALYFMILLVAAIVFIVTTGLSFGALFPNKETDDPEVISTSIPGLSFTALSLIFGALTDYILYLSLEANTVSWIILYLCVVGVIVASLLTKVPRIASRRVF